MSTGGQRAIKVFERPGAISQDEVGAPDAGDTLVGLTTAQTPTSKRATVGAVTAAGNAQGNATAITTAHPGIVIVAGGDGTKGVILPTAVAGMVFHLKNNAAAVLKVYPATGGAINALAANASLDMASLTSCVLVASSATQWYTVPLLPS